MVIYCIRNKVNGKLYVGKFTGICGIKTPCNSNDDFQKTKYWGSGKYLKNAKTKYGIENFEKWVLEENIQDHDYLCERETYWIKEMDCLFPKGYNLCEGGKGVYNPSESTRNKYRANGKIQVKKAIAYNEEHGNPMTGRKHTTEAKKIMSEKRTGHIQSEETKKKNSDSTKISWQNEDIRNKYIEAINKMVNDPIVKAKKSKSIKENWQKEGQKEKHSKRMTELWQDETKRENQRLRSVEIWSDEDRKEAQRQRGIARWKDEDYRSKEMAKRKARAEQRRLEKLQDGK